jgi:hypothetical protein
VLKAKFRNQVNEFEFGKTDAQFKNYYAAHYADVEHSLSVCLNNNLSLKVDNKWISICSCILFGQK